LRGIAWSSFDGLPTRYLFSYEKDIIAAYQASKTRGQRDYMCGAQRESSLALPSSASPECPERNFDLVEEGCPPEWPDVEKTQDRIAGHLLENPVPASVIGQYRDDESKVLVDARSRVQPYGMQALAFREAGPRSKVCFPNETRQLRVAMLVSGGLAPGINAVIHGIVDRYKLYLRHAKLKDEHQQLHILGYRDGFEGLRRADGLRSLETDIGDQAYGEGSLLRTSRVGELLGSAEPSLLMGCVRRGTRGALCAGPDLPLATPGGRGRIARATPVNTTAS